MTARNTSQQLFSLLKEKKHFLLLIPPEPSLDALCAALALAGALGKEKKHTAIVSPGFMVSHSTNFLTGVHTVLSDARLSRPYIISLPMPDNALDHLTYEMRDQNLEIYITAKNTSVRTDATKTRLGDFHYDAVIVFDAQDLKQFGDFYRNNADFFYSTPMVNFDHSPANDYFGNIHAIDINASSVSEILYAYLEKKFWSWHLDAEIATLLLTGIIAKTQCFQTSDTAPGAMLIAGKLMDAGAKHHDIIQHLYQQKSLSTLQLWGRALTRLKTHADSRIIFSVLESADFLKSQASESDLPDILTEILVTSSGAQVAVLLYEKNSDIHAFVSVPKYIDGVKLFSDFSPIKKHAYITLSFPNATLASAEEILLPLLKKALQKKYPF